MMSSTYIGIGTRVEFTSDIESRRLTGKLGTCVRHKINGVGWAVSVIELDSGGYVELWWSRWKCWKTTDIPKPKPKPRPPRKVSFSWAWYDLWIGAYIDTDNRAIYICPLPTMLIKVNY